MNKITIEFFHDTICSFCFPMSYRMRRLKEVRPAVEIVHRSFALVRSGDDFAKMFGSRAAAKDKILTHWQEANRNDDLHRFNIAGMQQADFLFPTSMNALLACKAAFFVAGEDGYWDVFDALQTALFVESKNTEDVGVIRACVQACGIDLGAWAQYFASTETLAAVEDDLARAERYGIHSVPTLVINGRPLINGAQSLEEIIRAIDVVGADA